MKPVLELKSMIVIYIVKVDVVMTVVVVGCPWKGNSVSISMHASSGACSFGTSQPSHNTISSTQEVCLEEKGRLRR